jgi:SP family myo-inositol transporter-like MFS transporter 13
MYDDGHDSAALNGLDPQSIQLEGMAVQEPDDRIAAAAPLLTRHSIEDIHTDLDRQQLGEFRGSGSFFVWALTFSAGISGLLFGYE